MCCSCSLLVTCLVTQMKIWLAPVWIIAVPVKKRNTAATKTGLRVCVLCLWVVTSVALWRALIGRTWVQVDFVQWQTGRVAPRQSDFECVCEQEVRVSIRISFACVCAQSRIIVFLANWLLGSPAFVSLQRSCLCDFFSLSLCM